MKKEFASQKHLRLLHDRIQYAEETDAKKSLIVYLQRLHESKMPKVIKLMVVGAGGSYSVAIFAKYALQEMLHTPYVDACTPQTAIRIIKKYDKLYDSGENIGYDAVIAISYSGTTPDIISTYELCCEKDIPFVLLTGAEKSKLIGEEYEGGIYNVTDESANVISYFNKDDNTGGENGMVSIASTLIPMLMFDNSLKSTVNENNEIILRAEKFINEMEMYNISDKIFNNPLIHVFYEYETLPSAIDIQTKFEQSGLANVILHEKKNFANGEYTSLFKSNFSLVINLLQCDFESPVNSRDKKIKYRNPYDYVLKDFLSEVCERKSAIYIELQSIESKASNWNLDIMFMLPYFITEIGNQLNIDISKPFEDGFPEIAKKLYSYRGKF